MKLALFDFDETLIYQNSLGYLFKEVTNKRFIFPSTLSLIFEFDTYRHGIKFSIKRRLYKSCLAGVSEKKLYEAGKTSSKKLHPLDEVVDCLHELHKQNYIIWIVTATPALFVKGVINQWGWPVERVIGTELYQNNNIYTGDLGEECMKEEKVKRINDVIKSKKLEPTIEIAFGNLPVDIPMMSLANKSYAVAGKQVVIFN
ncbi:Phosphoserine phosphatase [Bathymodiolus heckerae thiotrophic gill symbiont]|uniref:HAD family hydrolase n=1 Tax=Bathymodiolus heckerae thiotrophic gill symbiont TaxID=1052212 RepID=UPI0010BBF9CE|nr:HAD family hydrolase [Bathymodiolus heckerae thiotrophic gill symbiont]SHN92009.1 Phosphoserine phosphatase [Bathymodiolus heckerae thiotrophic gill symbiont]